MQVAKLASEIAKAEGHKSQSRIGDIREIISILADMSYKSKEPLQAITALGISRAKRKNKQVTK
jgi:hypothetical protein